MRVRRTEKGGDKYARIYAPRPSMSAKVAGLLCRSRGGKSASVAVAVRVRTKRVWWFRFSDFPIVRNSVVQQQVLGWQSWDG